MTLFEKARERERKRLGQKPRRNANVKTFGDPESVMPLVIGTEDHSVEDYIIFYSKKLKK